MPAVVSPKVVVGDGPMWDSDVAKEWEAEWGEFEPAKIADQIAAEEAIAAERELAAAEAAATRGLAAVSLGPMEEEALGQILALHALGSGQAPVTDTPPPASATASLLLPPPPANGTSSIVIATDTVNEAGVTVERFFITSDGTHANNDKCPLLHYRSVFADLTALCMADGWSRPQSTAAEAAEPKHVFHSNSWEALVVVHGEADVQFGGPLGPCLRPRRGDLVLVPPGCPRLVHGEGASGFAMLSSFPQHEGGRLSAVAPDACSGKPSPLESVNIVSVPAPFLCPRFGEAPPWAGGFGRLLLHPTLGASAVAGVARRAPKAASEERAPQRVERPEAPLRVVGPQRGHGRQRKLPNGTWEHPRRNVVYARLGGGAPTMELGCGDLRVISIYDVKRWIASRPGQPAASRLRIHVKGQELDDDATLFEAGVDYEGELVVV